MSQLLMFPGLVNSPETTTTTSISAVDTQIGILDISRIPRDLPNLLVLGSGTNAETVKVTAIDDGTSVITVVRAFQGIAKDWLAGTVIARNFTAYDYDTLRTNVLDLNDQIVKGELAIANGDSFVGFGYEPLGGVVRIDDDDPRIIFSKGDWTRGVIGVVTPRREGLKTRNTITNVIGASMEVTFIGTALIFDTAFDSGCGKIGVSIDGGAETIYDLYSVIPVYSQDILIASGLTFGKHTVVITVKQKNPASAANYVYCYYFDVLTTTTSSIKLARDGVLNKSSALTMGHQWESDTDITQAIDEITQLVKNASFKQISPVYGIVFQDDFNRANGAVGNGWSSGSIVSNKLNIAIGGTSLNGSLDWTDREIKFPFVAPASNIWVYLLYKDANNFVYANLVSGGSSAMYKKVNSKTTVLQDSGTSYSISVGATYYVTARKKGDLYSLSITTNADYVTNATTIYGYASDFTKGQIGVSSSASNIAALVIDNIEVNTPVPYGWLINGSVGGITSFTTNIVKQQGNITGASDGLYIPSDYGGCPMAVAGQSYTLRVKRKISSYISGDGVGIHLTWKDSSNNTISTSSSTNVTQMDDDFVEVSLTAIAPTNTHHVQPLFVYTGVLTVEWKEPLLELTSTATGVFHEKESRMDLVSLDTDGDIVVTKGTGESEIGYRVEQDGVISKFYRDSKTIPHWDRAKVWTGGTGRLNYIEASQSGGSGIYSNVLNDSLYISFVGTGIDVITALSTGSGIVGVTIDNGTEFLVDLYASSIKWQNRSICIKGLSYGQHQVKLRVTATSNGLTGNVYIYPDAFDIYVPKIPASPANTQPLGAVLKTDPDDGWIRYEETEGVVYSGTWTTSSFNAVHSNGHIKFSNTLNDYIEFSAVCSGFRWIDQFASSHGIAEIFTDEGSGYISRGTIDAYNASYLYQKVAFTRSMTLQLNKIKVVCTYTKNASASDYYIGIDAFEVKQPLYVIDLRKQLPEGTKKYIDQLLGDVYNLKSKKNVAESLNDGYDHSLSKLTTGIHGLMTTGNMTLYVNGSTGSDINPGTSALPFKTIQAAINSLPKIFNANNAATINVAEGTYNETVTIGGFVGVGYITIQGAGDLAGAANYVVNNFDIRNCTISLLINGFKAVSTSTAGFSAAYCPTQVQFDHCMCITASSSIGFFFGGGSQGLTNGCKVANRSVGCQNDGSLVSSMSWDSGSTGNTVGLSCWYAGTLGKYGTQPAGTTAESTNVGGIIRS